MIAAGYRTVEAVRDDIHAVRARTDRPFGLNLLIAPGVEVEPAVLEAYAHRLAGEAERWGVPLGAPRADDDGRAEKISLAAEERVPVVSFAFGCPTAEEIEELHAHGCEVWVTVTEPEEAELTEAAGADVLVLQGVEAGGHRGSFDDTDGSGERPLLELLHLVAPATRLPLVAAGGIMDGAGIATVLEAGVVAAQLGTAFLLCPEAGTSDGHRRALRAGGATALTRAFSGRRARGLVNRFLSEHTNGAPAAYPHVHHMTAPLRAAARAAGDEEAVNLWAGTGVARIREMPAAELVATLVTEIP